MRYLDGSTDPRLPGAPLPASAYATVHLPGHVPDTAGQAGPQLGDFLRVLQKRWRLIAGFAAGALLLMALMCLVMQPRYTATAVLHVGTQAPQVTTNIQQVVLPPSYFENVEFFQDQVKMLESRALAAGTIRELGLAHDPRFTGRNEKPGLLTRVQWTLLGLFAQAQAGIGRLLHGEPPDAGSQGQAESSGQPVDVPPGLVGKLRSELDIAPVTNTRLIRISFTSPSPALAQKVANAHAEQYIRRTLQANFELTGEARHFLEAEIQRVEFELAVTEQALNNFRRQHNVVSLDERENAIVDRLTDLSRRLTEAEAARITAEADYRLVKSREYDSLPAVIQNGLVQTLKNQVTQLEIRQAELGEYFLAGNPQLQEVNSQLRQARARLDREIARVVGGIESVYLAAQAKEDSLRAEFQQQQNSVLNLKEVSGQYIKLEQAVTGNRNLYNTLLTRLQETDVVKGAQISNASVMDRAELPTGPSEPNVVFNLAFSLIFGLGLGVSMAFVLEHLDSSLKTPEDVRQVLRLPTLGMVPHFAYLPRPRRQRLLRQREVAATEESLPARMGDLVGFVPEGCVHAEAYRGIRTSLLFCNPENPPRTVLLTSSQAGEGKTSTTVNLAISLTQLGNSIVVVDADLRQPRCHWSLGIAPGPGLAEVLREQVELDEVIQRLALDNGKVTPASAGSAVRVGLDLLQSGGPVSNPSELLASPRMRAVLQSLTERYDIVLVDSPPIFPVTDAALLATVVDGVVLVVRGHRTDRQITREALERLRFMNATILGVVLNGVDPDSSEYYKHSYYFGSERVA